jgi:hypothetical protein
MINAELAPSPALSRRLAAVCRPGASGIRLLDQQRSRRVQGQDALQLQALGWHELHVGP